MGGAQAGGQVVTAGQGSPFVLQVPQQGDPAPVWSLHSILGERVQADLGFSR